MVRYIFNLENNFLKICNSKLGDEEYYRLIVNVGEYDGIVYTKDSINIKVPGTYKQTVYNWLGKAKLVKKTKLFDKEIGIYALRDRTGIYEMVTGKKISIYGGSGQLYCYGVVREEDLSKIGNDLRFLDDNPKYKNQYIDSLLSLSNSVYESRESLDKMQQIQQQEKDSSIQYVKSYRMPRN